MIAKRHFARMATIGAFLALAACATGDARSTAGAALKSGDYLGAFRVLKPDLASAGDTRRRAVRQFDASKDGRDGLVAGFQKAIHGTSGLDQVAQLTAELTLADASGLLTSEQAGDLRHLLQLTLSKRIADGTIFLHLGDVLDTYPTLAAAPEIKQRLIENTLRVIEANAPGSQSARRQPVTALFQALAGADRDSHGLVESALPQMRFSIRELKLDVHPIFPGYAERALDAMVTDVAIVGSTRLLEVDIGGILETRDELAVTRDNQRADAVLEITELQYRERQIGPVQRPVKIMPQAIAPLFRPAGVPEEATFMYDLVESTFDVEWAYETSIVRGGDLYAHDVIRGVETRTDRQCHNGRYVTAAGHEIPSSAWPTADVSLSCRGAGPPAASGLQPAIMKKVGEQVLQQLVAMEAR